MRFYDINFIMPFWGKQGIILENGWKIKDSVFARTLPGVQIAGMIFEARSGQERIFRKNFAGKKEKLLTEDGIML